MGSGNFDATKLMPPFPRVQMFSNMHDCRLQVSQKQASRITSSRLFDVIGLLIGTRQSFWVTDKQWTQKSEVGEEFTVRELSPLITEVVRSEIYLRHHNMPRQLILKASL